MAETALSMASSILGSAINKAATAVAEEMSLVMGVQKEIWFMKDELKTMQAFLIAAEAMKKKTPLLKVWAKQVRSLSYDIEDYLDEFMVHVGSQRLSRQLMKLKDHHRIAVQIRNLKSRVEEVSSRNTRYNLIQMEDTEIDQALSYLEDVRNHSARNIDEAELVGTSTFKKNLLDKINAHYDDGHDRVICVVGMGGLGKTTLVRKIYESKEGIENKFPYRAWITVSQSLSRIDVLKGMIRQLFGDTFLKTCLKSLDGMAAMQMQVDHLGKYLAEELKDKRLHQGYSSGCSRVEGVKVPRGIGNLKELQILKVVGIKRTSSRAIEELAELSKLRKLGVKTEGATEKKCITLCKSIQKLSSLHSLKIDAGSNGTLEWLDSVSSLPLLRSLTLTGRIGDKVDWFRNLTQLVKLHLWWSGLEEGKAMEILGALPNLMLLHFECDAYVGKKLVFRQGAFQNLRKLHFYVLMTVGQLREIRFEQDASPQMESIRVNGRELKIGINGIKHLPKLKEISVLGIICTVVRLGMLQEEVNAHPNQPVLRLRMLQSHHDLGDPEGTGQDSDAAESLPDHNGEGMYATTPTTSATVNLT